MHSVLPPRVSLPYAAATNETTKTILANPLPTTAQPPRPPNPKRTESAFAVAFILLGVAAAGLTASVLHRSGRVDAWLERTSDAVSQLVASEPRGNRPSGSALQENLPPTNSRPSGETYPKAVGGHAEERRVTTAQVPALALPSDGFARRVTGFRVTGVVRGNPIRALIDGRKVAVGDWVDVDRGIRLLSADLTNRRLIFENRLKAQAVVKY